MTAAALYREQVLQHAKAPRHFRRVDDATIHVPGHNPLCGDKLELFVTFKDGQVVDVSFQATACAICVASASMLAELLSGLDLPEANVLTESVRQMLSDSADEALPDMLVDLPIAALKEVRRYPSRVKCASLAWQAMAAALDGRDERISTE
ncbi:MAG: Fe-S cluster assembly sulfur transfer protein SufU [Pseudomonadota bacterium]